MVTDAAVSDEQLMIAYRDGDAGAFDTLYRKHKGGVYRYMLRQCRDAGVADELFQDVWMNLIRARASYTVQAKFTTYIYKMAHNRLIDHYRKHGQALMVSFDDDSADHDSAPVWLNPPLPRATNRNAIWTLNSRRRNCWRCWARCRHRSARRL